MNPNIDRVYHFHIRKTAGSSLDSAFWALGGPELEKASVREGQYGKAVEGNGLKFVQHDSDLIAAGDYFYASSHEPAYLLDIPPRTFTITIFRDPVARVFSYFRYLLWARENPNARDREPFIDQVRTESSFLDGPVRYSLSRVFPRRPMPHRRFTKDDFPRFLERVPNWRLMSQLHMFSERLDPREAAENALQCDAICSTETF